MLCYVTFSRSATTYVDARVSVYVERRRLVFQVGVVQIGDWIMYYGVACFETSRLDQQMLRACHNVFDKKKKHENDIPFQILSDLDPTTDANVFFSSFDIE